MIFVVSGLPRSGTSLMMQMLSAGGLTPLTDGQRAPDVNNPRGYFEWEKAKSLPGNPGCIAEADGKVVKVISSLLLSLPSQFSYKVIFMERPLAEVVASQAAMIQKLGVPGAKLSSEAMIRALDAHLRQVKASLALRPEVAICWMRHDQVLCGPAAAAASAQQFFGIPLDLAAMAAQVDASLYRQRAGAGGRSVA
ncbi:MAG: sulfotransferase domain-containing protein [Terriglobia bacterium]